MKRFGKFLMIAALAIVSSSASAELAPQWSKGTLLFNANAGFSYIGADASVDYVLIDKWWKGHFTVGAEFDFSNPQKHESAWGLTPRATYGINITPEFEVHATVGIGFGTWKYKSGDINNDGSFIMYNDFIGCRYFFSEHFAALAEVGSSYYFSGYRLGISIKF